MKTATIATYFCVMVFGFMLGVTADYWYSHEMREACEAIIESLYTDPEVTPPEAKGSRMQI